MAGGPGASLERVIGTRRVALTAALCLVGAAVLLSYAPAWTAMGRDDGLFAYTGHELLRGRVPYRDFWDHKPPVIHLLNAVAVALDPHGRWGIWLASCTAAITAIALASVVLCSAFGPAVGLLTAALHTVVLLDPKIYENGNLTELYALPLQWIILLGVACPGTRRTLRAFGAGLAAGAAAGFKPTTCALALAVVSRNVFLFRTDRRSRRELAPFLVGTLVVPAVLLVWLARADALAAAYDCVIRFNRVYATPAVGSAFLRAAYATLSKDPISLLGTLTALSLLVRVAGERPTAKRVACLALMALPIELLGLGVQGRYYGHYYLTLLPVLSIRAAVFFSALSAARRWPPRVSYWGVVMLLGFSAGRLGLHVYKYHVGAGERRDQQRQIIAATTAATTPGDTVLAWGAELSLNYLAARDTPSMYGYVYPLFTPGYTTATMWRRFADDLRQHPPARIIDGSGRTTWPPAPIPSLDELTAQGAPSIPSDISAELRTFLLTGYERAGTVGGFPVWVRRRAPR